MSKGDKNNITKRRKPKTPQKENVNEVDGRDTFQTPNYATELLLPFIPKDVGVIWECACGLGKIVRVLLERGYGVAATDLLQGVSFLVDDYPENYNAIITNPPFSLKKKFFLQCLKYQLPFALLIPADYSGWLIEAVDKYGCEKIIPTRRIDYITPNILRRIQEGEVFSRIPSDIIEGWKLEEFKENNPLTWEHYFKMFSGMFMYKTIYDAPSSLLRKYSSSYYHSMWLTWGFNVGRTETFVELTNEQKNNI